MGVYLGNVIDDFLGSSIGSLLRGGGGRGDTGSGVYGKLAGSRKAVKTSLKIRAHELGTFLQKSPSSHVLYPHDPTQGPNTES